MPVFHGPSEKKATSPHFQRLKGSKSFRRFLFRKTIFKFSRKRIKKRNRLAIFAAKTRPAHPYFLKNGLTF
jgi:hypothetical protein